MLISVLDRIQEGCGGGEGASVQDVAQRYRNPLSTASNERELTDNPAYQMEIDALTRRSKTTENSFLNVYKLLAEAPDPFPLLDAAVVRLSSPESKRVLISPSRQDQTAKASEARLLEAELSRHKDQVAQLKQQLLEAQNVEKERKRMADKVDKFEIKVRRFACSHPDARLTDCACD